jgi:endoglucanase
MQAHRSIVRFSLALALAAASAVPALAAPVSMRFKLDHFGYRPADTKIAIVTQNPGATVEVRSAVDDSVVYTIPTDGGSITSKGADGAPSGDTVWWVDFSPLATVGEYRLYSAAIGGQSYDFDIRGDVYATPMRTALKSFYLQRCNVPKTVALAGNWADPAPCHTGDQTTTNAAGHTNHGTKDLRGGWHDAGDYNKYVWGAASLAILNMLRTYEENPTVLRDDDIGIPESGNGLPDLLDEVKVELDWFLTMQLPNGSVLYQMHVPGFAADSPPSVDANLRYYQDPTIESGAVAAGSFALGSRLFAAEGQAVYAATLKSAALAAWTWLQTQGNSNYKVWAAAEVFRMDPTQTAARTYVDNYYGAQWAGRFFNVVDYDTYAAMTYVKTAGATPAVVSNMLDNMSNQVDYIFSEDDLYRNGMPDWSYYWGSNAIRSGYGLFLLDAAALGATGSHTPAECVEHALDILHFFHGQNTLNMLYLTNMAAAGGEHSSFQFYHAWYGDYLNTHSRTNFVGKPASIVEPDYPYYKGTDNHGVSDNKSSLYGPPPGIVPGGPNKDYTGDATPPLGSVNYNRFYRDWADQTVWTAMTWQISENSIGYQGPYVALAASFQGASVCDDDDVCEAGETSANCPNDCPACDDDDVCESGETNANCPNDCPPPCDNDDVCEDGETTATCPNDCPVCDDDDTCEAGETTANCPNDCPAPDAYVQYKTRVPRETVGGAPIAGDNALPDDWIVTLNDSALDDGDADDPENFRIRGATGLADPAELDVAGTPSSPNVHYVRYAASLGPESTGAGEPVAHAPRVWTVQNPYGTWTLTSSRATTLMLPAGAATGGAASAPSDATHYLCYKVKQTSGPTRTQILARDFFDDCALDPDGAPAFDGSAAEGRCLVDLSKAAELCNPVAKSAVEPPRLTSAVIDESTPTSSASLLCMKAKLARKVAGSAAGLLTGLAEGASVSQTKHVARRTSNGNPVATAPGNQFPNPVALDTSKRAAVCISSEVLSVVPQ